MSPRRRPRPPEQAPEHDPGPPAGRRAPRPQDNELHYGEANRRRASEFAAEGNGRRTRRPPAPPRWSDYEPEASTVELAVHQDVFGLAVESPGVTQQPLAPWMTGEHRAIEVDAPPPVDAPGPPPDPGYPEPAPGRSVFDTPAPPGAYDEPDAYAEPPQAAPNGYAHPPQAAPNGYAHPPQAAPNGYGQPASPDAPQAYAATPDAPPYGQPANPDAPPDTDPAGYAPDAPAGYAPDGPPYTDPAGYAPDAPPYADPAGYAPDGPPYGQPDARPGARGPAYGQPGAPGGPAYREPPWGPSAGVPMGAAPAGTAWPPPVGPPLGGEGDSLTGEVPVVPPAGPPPGPAAPGVPPPSTRGSFLVAAGILLSRCAGLIREVVIGAFLGVGPAADAFKAALRIPNLMQNLLGEGVLSASFIPVYARLRGEGRHEEAGRLAGAIAGLLIALTGAISLLGVVFTEPLTRLLVPGYSGRTFDLTVQLTRIMFPGMGFLVLSAWCLGVLNSHRKFFLSYVAPVIWNVAQIAFLLVGVLVVGGYSTLEDKSSLAVALAWGVLVGGVLQFAIQIGPVHRLLGSLRLSLDTGSEAVRSVLSRFVPVLLGRGCIQIMGWVDLWLASYLVTGAVSSLTYTMVLYLLPVSLFGVSVAAAELPDLSQVEVHDPETRRRFRLRLEDSMARIAWYVAPTATLFIVVGDVIVRAVLEHGSFSEADTVAVWLALAFLSMGLLPITASRLLQNGLYALDDARTPARLGVVGVVLAAVFGVFLMFPLDRLFVTSTGIQGWDHIFTFGPLPEVIRANPLNVPHLGIVGLAIGATMSDWIEYRLLSRSLAWRIGRTHLAGRWLNQIAIGCAVTAAVAYGAALAFSGLPALIAAVLVTGPAAAAYLAVTYRLHVPEAEATVVRLQAAVNRARSGVR